MHPAYVPTPCSELLPQPHIYSQHGLREPGRPCGAPAGQASRAGRRFIITIKWGAEEAAGEDNTDGGSVLRACAWGLRVRCVLCGVSVSENVLRVRRVFACVRSGCPGRLALTGLGWDSWPRGGRPPQLRLVSGRSGPGSRLPEEEFPRPLPLLTSCGRARSWAEAHRGPGPGLMRGTVCTGPGESGVRGPASRGATDRLRPDARSWAQTQGGRRAARPTPTPRTAQRVRGHKGMR